MDDDGYANAPTSITEARSLRTPGGADVWTVRDMLVHVLRLIDRGELDPTWAGLVLATTTETGTQMDYFQRCQSTLQLVGMHHMAATRMSDGG